MAMASADASRSCRRPSHAVPKVSAMDKITCDADLEAGMAALRALGPHWGALIDRTGLPPLRRREGGFSALASIIVSQQLSVASARAVWLRVETVLAPLTPARILAASDEEMRLSGLSRPKQRTLRALAGAVGSGGLALEALETATPEEVHARLTAVSGIGPWTADVYLMVCLGHRDGFCAGDLAIQEAARAAFGLAARPDAAEMARLAEGWRPWRGVAARLLWAYYATMKRREGVATP